MSFTLKNVLVVAAIIFVLMVALCFGDTVITVTRRPVIVVTTQNGEVQNIVTQVSYLVEIPLKVGVWRDAVYFPDFTEVLKNPSVVTNALYARASAWDDKLNANWPDLYSLPIVFKAEPITVSTNEVA